jgi:hypothetical protein
MPTFQEYGRVIRGELEDKALLIDDAKASFDCKQTTLLDFLK